MNTTMNGKKISEIWLGNPENPERVLATPNMTLELSATYHGDHDEFWVVKKVAGTETERYNTRNILTIKWIPV